MTASAPGPPRGAQGILFLPHLHPPFNRLAIPQKTQPTPRYRPKYAHRFVRGTKEPISIPPASKGDLSPGDEIARLLAPLVGKPLQLTGKTRTDGSHLRKTVARVLEESSVLPIPAAEPSATKNRGQQLEQIVASGLGYPMTNADVLIGGYQDIRHQALEVKIQDAPTVDLGRYSPQFDEAVEGCPGFSTQSVRYLIALTDPKSG